MSMQNTASSYRAQAQWKRQENRRIAADHGMFRSALTSLTKKMGGQQVAVHAVR